MDATFSSFFFLVKTDFSHNNEDNFIKLLSFFEKTKWENPQMLKSVTFVYFFVCLNVSLSKTLNSSHVFENTLK